MSFSRVTPKHKDVHDTEASITEKQDIDEKQKEADIGNKTALTKDIIALTRLKVGLSVFIALFMVSMFIFQWVEVGKYLGSLTAMQKEVPKEVIIAILAASSSVVTLMGFILKGLFRSK